MRRAKDLVVDREGAEVLAIAALSFLAEEPERLSRFLALTGISPAEIRAVARDPGFLGAVLEHVMGDESLLLTFAAQANRDPGAVSAARTALAGRPWEHETP
jgi:hypothetical protein